MILYSTGCPLCRTLEERMKQAGVSYTLITDEKDIIDMGFQTVPILYANGKFFNFSEAMELINSIIKENVNENQHQAG